jgi:hypothetical protein
MRCAVCGLLPSAVWVGRSRVAGEHVTRHWVPSEGMRRGPRLIYKNKRERVETNTAAGVLCWAAARCLQSRSDATEMETGAV